MSYKVWFLIWLLGLSSFFSPWLSSTGEAIPIQERMVINDQEVRVVLAKLGYLPSPGGHSRATVEKAILAFQTADGLDADGIVGVKTQNAMLKRFLVGSVPEIATRQQQLGQRFVCYLEGYPDPSEQDPYHRNYYRIYTGTDMRIHVTAWNRFVIRKDLGEVLWQDPTKSNPREQYKSLERWRLGR